MPARTTLCPETLAMHGGGFRSDPATGAVPAPIHQAASFQLPDTTTADRLFSLDEAGYIHTRVADPTQDALEGAAGALALARHAARWRGRCATDSISSASAIAAPPHPGSASASSA